MHLSDGIGKSKNSRQHHIKMLSALFFVVFDFNLQLKISPVMGIIRRIRVTGQTIRPLNYRTLKPLIYKGFITPIWLIFNCNESIFNFLIFATENSLCRKSNPKIGGTGQTIRTPHLQHFQSIIYQRFQALLFPLFKANKSSF